MDLQAERGRHVDKTYLDWPFFEDAHRALERDVDAWAATRLSHAGHGSDVDAVCRALVRDLGHAGWLKCCVPAAYGGAREQIDSRSLCILRETLGRHDGLADFAFAMQGLGSGAISIAGTTARNGSCPRWPQVRRRLRLSERNQARTSRP
jgi:acyl-CoA dehydrogenase